MKITKKIKFVVSFLCFAIANSMIAFCSAQGAVSNLADKGMDIVAVIPAAMGIFNFFQAGLAYSQAQSDGGNAQASGKMANCIIAGVVCIAVTVATVTVFKPMVVSLTASGG